MKSEGSKGRCISLGKGVRIERRKGEANKGKIKKDGKDTVEMIKGIK